MKGGPAASRRRIDIRRRVPFEEVDRSRSHPGRDRDRRIGCPHAAPGKRDGKPGIVKFPGKDIEKSAVFWLACDYFEKARRSEDCSIDASSNISKYRKYFPNKEEAFMENLKEGATYHVGGWINENTKVRF